MATATVAVALAVTAGCGRTPAAGAVPGSAADVSGTAAPRSVAPTTATITTTTTSSTEPTTGPTRSAPRGGPVPTHIRPAFVVTRFRWTHVSGGDLFFAPPPAGIRPEVTAARAFALARRYWPDPHGRATPVVALALYTNDGQGTTLPGGGLRRFDVRRLTWVVIDYGVDCAPAGGPAQPNGSPTAFDRVHHDCLVLTFVDARTGADRNQTDEGGPGVRDLTTG